MDEARHPQVVRTWTVERTKDFYRPPQPSKPRPGPRQDSFRGPGKKPQHPGPAPQGGQ